MVSLLNLHIEKNEYQEGLLYGDCVGPLLGVGVGVLIGMIVGKPDGYIVGCWIERKLGTPCSRPVFIVSLPFILAQWALKWAIFSTCNIFSEATVLLCEVIFTVFYV